MPLVGTPKLVTLSDTLMPKKIERTLEMLSVIVKFTEAIIKYGVSKPTHKRIWKYVFMRDDD